MTGFGDVDARALGLSSIYSVLFRRVGAIWRPGDIDIAPEELYENCIA